MSTRMTTRRTRSSLLQQEAQEAESRAGPGPTTAASRRSLLLAPPQETIETAESAQTAVSVASLPRRYGITVAFSPAEREPAERVAKRRRIEGEEALADAWRRDAHLGRPLYELRAEQAAQRRRAANGKQVDVKGKRKDPSDCMWYTAAMHFPCTCQLPHLPHAASPPIRPPLASELESLPPHPQPRQIPVRAASLQPWATALPAIDLDPAMDEMLDFEHGWSRAKGNFASAAGQNRRGADDRPNGRAARSAATPLTGRREADLILKGKDGASHSLTQAIGSGHPEDGVAPGTSSSNAGPVELIPHPALSWEEDAKRRKAQWRSLICGDAGYGALFAAIPLVSHASWRDCTPKTRTKRLKDSKPHSVAPLPPPYRKPHDTQKRLPASTVAALAAKPFILPKYFAFPLAQRDPSPYHPDISRFITRSPTVRVYWLIPVHGPVIIPTVNEMGSLGSSAAMTTATPISQEEASIILSQFNDTQASSGGLPSVPVPSTATLSSDRSLPLGPAPRPAPLRWTPALLRHFWTDFILPLQKDPVLPLGPISLALSGPKPDPFIALKPAPALKKHLRAGKAASAAGLDTPQPLRVEAGDHIRLYCDAEHALRLRTWLYGIEVDIAAVQQSQEEGSGPSAALGRGEPCPADRVTSRSASSVIANEKGGGSIGFAAKANDLRRAVLLSKQSAGDSAGILPIGAKSSAGDRPVGRAKLVKLFDKARLTLVGPRGEVLIVA